MQKIIHLIGGARPNFIKIAPLYHALAATPWATPVFIHTGQHYDYALSDLLWQQLRLPPPLAHFGIGAGHANQQLAALVLAYDELLTKQTPDLVVAVGDVNASLAVALAAKKRHLPLAHLEAGLRSHDRTMPEELNRIAIDALADYHWCPTLADAATIARERNLATPPAVVGNIMIDSLVQMQPAIAAAGALAAAGVQPNQYGIVTLHRPHNVDDVAMLATWVKHLGALSQQLPLLWPVHPRTAAQLAAPDLQTLLATLPQLRPIAPLGYLEFMQLVGAARLVLTDSGGLQEETSYLGVPCLTLRPNTERPMTLTHGTNRLVSLHTLAAEFARALGQPRQPASIPLWDGQTAPRIVAQLAAMWGL